MEITYFQKDKRLTSSGLGAGLFPVDRVADESLLIFEIFKFPSSMCLL